MELLLKTTTAKWAGGAPIKFKDDGSIVSKYWFIGPYLVRDDGKIEIKNRHQDAKGMHWVFELSKDQKTAKNIKEKGTLQTNKVLTISE